MQITLEITKEDLSFIYVIGMDWDEAWSSHADRFDVIDGKPISYEFKKAYWLQDWISVMIFKSYLESINASFQILMDNAENLDPYLVICHEEF
jgi:hypothetical protein